MRLTGKSEWEATLQEEGRSDRAPAQEEDNQKDTEGSAGNLQADTHTNGPKKILENRLYQISTGLMVVLSEKKEPLYERVRSEEEENKK
ncbi:hypothetical protein PPACK8108_LOCUS23346 [Phakopsora pachyrhizi]|uniref:Uncharacterized protein n=1 Tax=Phakopsora pachyrhizi TaxID=170000 RepID=A0AAV0BM55_PHAPC|nr:hypothetical protein PPACK8108_LOCUS23346 [Phakopsora pachyrhizi]